MKKKFILCGILLSLLFFGGLGFAKIEVPGRTNSWVNDYAGIIDEDTKRYLEKLLSIIEQKTPDPIEVIIATFKSLEGWQPEDFALRYGENWRMAKRGRRDNGVIILVVLKGQWVMIGAGQNLKGILTDAVINDIMHNVIVPEFSKENYSEAIKKGAETIVKILSNAEIPKDSLIATNLALLLLFIMIVGTIFIIRYFHMRSLE